MSGVGEGTARLELLAVGFEPGTEYRGRILRELEQLERAEVIRVVDLLLVTEDEVTGELGGVAYREDGGGSLVASLLGPPFSAAAADASAVRVAGPSGSGLPVGDLDDLVNERAAGEAMAVLLIEHVWARRLDRAITDAGGTPLLSRPVSTDAVALAQRSLDERDAR
jgi:hypothetical protein